jgi:LacI family transcriptional regulator
MALGAYKVSRREGLQIPSDLAIVGFDDIPLAEYVEPALTTVHQPIYRIGRRAAEILTRRVLDADADGTAGVREVFRTRVVIRESCGARTPGRQP